MSIIIRLQNLPWSANSLDIRRFFQGLSIPDGGVHIVGGEKGDAFIAFVNDEDARQAMAKDNGTIKDAQIKLFLSSRNEMQKVIDMARNGMQAPVKSQLPVLPGPNHHQAPLNDQMARGLVTHERRDRSRSPIGRRDFLQPSNGPQQAPGAGLQFQAAGPGTPMGGLQPSMTGGDIRSRLGGYATDLLVHVDNNHWRPELSNQNNPQDIRSRLNPPLNPNLNPPMNDQRPFIQDPRLPQPDFRTTGITFNGKAEVRGLSPTTTSRDIHEFLKCNGGLLVAEHDIHILVDDRGFPTGGATIKVQNEADLKVAVSLSGRFLVDRRLEITPLLGDLNIDSANSLGPVLVPPQRDFVIYMKGIPFNSCTDRDVANFFQDLRITDIVFETDRQTGKPAGNAYVEFPTREDYEGALALNLRHMGRRYIGKHLLFLLPACNILVSTEVFPTTKEDMDDARVVSPEKQTHCINVSGLPPTITNGDLTSYFKEVGAIPFAIHMMLNKNGQNAGEAFLEFTTPDLQMRALSKDGEVINGYKIIIKDVPFTLMRRIIGRPLNPQGAGPSPQGRNDRRDDRNSRGGHRGGRNFDRGNRNADRFSPSRRRDPFSDLRSVILASNVPYKVRNPIPDRF